jgi:hypothetical protein
MHTPDLDTVVKYLKKLHKKWPDEKIEKKAKEILEQYLDYHKDAIKEKILKEKQEIEEDLEKESLQWWLMWKAGEL